MKAFRLRKKSWIAVIGTVLLFAVAFVVGLLLNSLGSVAWGSWRGILNVSLFFAVLGAYYGTIVALDGRSEMTNADHPVLRTTLCGALGAILVLLVQAWPPQSFNALWPVAGAVVGGALGWFGWSWAKHVDF
jgi:hypothetical protein